MKVVNKEKLLQQNDWTWTLATPLDVQDIVDMARENFQVEVDNIFTINEQYYHYNIATAVTDQIYYLQKQQLIVCRSNITGALLAYAWVGRGTLTPYSFDEIAEARMAHLDLNLSARKRFAIITQMIEHWEAWARACGIPVLVSTSIRQEQTAFMRLHQQLGFSVKGSIAYKRLQEQINE